MYRCITVPAGTAAATFLKALQEELYHFGRSDVALINTAEASIFYWKARCTTAASRTAREKAWTARLNSQRERLVALERRLDPDLFSAFTLDNRSIVPRIHPCSKEDDSELFDYFSFSQSIGARVASARFGRFLVYDSAVVPPRLMGLIGLTSPVYFNGARDAHLRWRPIFAYNSGRRILDRRAKTIKDDGLKSIFNISVCTLVAPYSRLRAGRLISSPVFRA
jgi:hypothetical protein